MDAVMDVGRPHASRKQQQFMRQEMHWDVQQRPAVRDRLRSQACIVKSGQVLKLGEVRWQDSTDCTLRLSRIRL